MIVASVSIVVSRGFGTAIICDTKFTTLEKAREEYERVAALITRRSDRANDLPKTVTIEGDAGDKTTVALDDISTVGLHDFTLSNEQHKGMSDNFPLLFPPKR